MIRASYIANSVLYVIMVFTAGLLWDRHLAVLFSIATAAIALACADQLLCNRALLGRWLAAISWAVGLVAGILLVWP
jgi:hypothetical protein